MLNSGLQTVQQPILTRRDEEDIPMEDNNIRRDVRFGDNLAPTGTYTNQYASSSIGQPISNISTLGQATTHVTATGERIQGYGEPVVVSSIPISSIGVPITSQSVNMQSNNIPLSTTTPVTYKDERVLEKHLPTTNTTAMPTATMSTSSQVIGGATTLPVLHSTLGPAHIITTEAPRTSITTSQVAPLVQSEIRTTQYVQAPMIEGVSEIQHVEEHMRDSISMGRQTEDLTHNVSRWENQQAQISSMRYESHQTFENWETNRNLFFSDRINVMDDLLAGMERKLEWLETGVQKVILFFKERESQEIEYSRRVKHGLTQLGDHFERTENGQIMSDFSRGMKESDAFHAQDVRNSEILGLFIKKDILDWILIPSEKEYKIQAHSLRTPLHDARKRLDHLASQRSRRYNKYFKLYDQLLKNPTKVSPKENGIFRRQLKYSLAAREELRMLRLYDEQGLLVISEFTRLATVRMAEIQRAFSLYLQKYTELYSNSAPTPTPILELVERSNGPDAIQSLFSPRSLLSVANYDFVTRKLGRSEFTYPDLVPFLVNFPESVDPARSSFVLKEWEAVKEGNLLHRPRACTVIATTGNSLLIVEKKHEERELGKVKDPLQMRFTKVENIEEGIDGTTLRVVERTPGTLFTHTHKAKLKFETQEEAQSFVSFLSQQTSQMIGDV